MRREWRFIAGFGVAGFSIPWPLLAFYAWAYAIETKPSVKLLHYLVPTSLFGWPEHLFSLLTWLLVSLSNAVLYSIVGFAVSIFVPRRHHP
jgi:hypothetical protein